MNKKGYIKTIEAVIAIVGILIFTFSVTPREPANPNQVPFVVDNAHDFIIQQLQTSENRQIILAVPIGENGDPDKEDPDFIVANDTIDSLVQDNLPAGYSYEFKICGQTTCLASNPPFGVSVYGDDVIIAGTVDGEAKARIVRVWFWPLA